MVCPHWVKSGRSCLPAGMSAKCHEATCAAAMRNAGLPENHRETGCEIAQLANANLQGGMKRFWIFLLAGPLIGFFGALFGGAGELLATPYVLLLLIVFYMFGAVPALLACLLDYGLSGKIGDFKRAAAISLFGCASGIFMAACFPEHVGIVPMAIAGSVAGLICSLMSGERQT
jgi:hypothetical protein